MAFLLTICIPTRNRATCLQELLESMLQNFCPDVNIVVSDNASADATSQVVEAFQTQGLPIVYSRLPESSEFGKNFLNAVSLARGKFLWFMGDDDRIVPLALAKLCRVLKEQEPDVFLMNYASCNHDFSKVVRHSAFPPTTTSGWIGSIESGVVSLNCLTFLGCLVVANSDRWKEQIAANVENNYPGTYAPFYYARSQRWWVSAEVGLEQRWPQGRSFNSEILFFRDLPEIFRYGVNQGISRKTIRAWKGVFLKATVMRSLLGEKILHGKFQIKVVLGLIRHFGRWPYTWFFLMPAYCLPCAFLKPLKARFSFNR